LQRRAPRGRRHPRGCSNAAAARYGLFSSPPPCVISSVARAIHQTLGVRVGIRLDSLPTPIPSRSKTEAEVRNPNVAGAGAGSGSLPSWPPAIHLRLRTAPPGSPLPSNPSEPTSPVVSPSLPPARPSHFLYFRGRFRRCSIDHLRSSGDLRPRRYVPSICSVWSCSHLCPNLFDP
jgi:hypothetical protein